MTRGSPIQPSLKSIPDRLICRLTIRSTLQGTVHKMSSMRISTTGTMTIGILIISIIALSFLVQTNRVWSSIPPTKTSVTQPAITDIWEYFLSENLLIVSMISILITIMIYAMTSELRTNFGYYQFHYLGTYLASDICMILSANASSIQYVCIGAAICLHHSLLASFSWMTVTSCYVLKTILSLNRVSTLSNSQPRVVGSRFVGCIVGHLVPFVFVLGCAICDLSLRPGSVGYGQGQFCWIQGQNSLLTVFIVPTGLILCTNVLVCLGNGILFLRFYIQNKSMAVSSLGNGWTMFILTKMLIGSGGQWLLGILLYLYPHEEVIRYIFIVLVSIHGILILITTLLLKVIRGRIINLAISMMHKLTS